MKDMVHTYKTKQGMKVILIKREGFVKTYCGIGCKYGGANVYFRKDEKEIRSPYGIAHFIEHKLFQMPDGRDAFLTFHEQNASANAYTASDKTMYYFTKNTNIEDSLKLLIEMYYTPIFLEEDVKREKSIIVSEIEMYEDNVVYRITQKGLEVVYPKDDYSFKIIGNKESVESTTVEDLYSAYEAFYTPANSVLCIVGNVDDSIFQKIEEYMEPLQFSNSNTKKNGTIQSKEVLKPMVMTEDVTQEEVMVYLRMDDITNLDKISCEKILGILECLFSVTTDFYKMLMKKHYLDNDIDYQVVTYKESSYVMISAPTKHSKELVDAILKRIHSLSPQALDPAIFNMYLKHLKAKSILSLDSIEDLGDTILSLALEDIDYMSCIQEILDLKFEDLISMIPSIRKAQCTYVIVKKKNS